MHEDQQIVFYDGDCGFCNKSVQFILAHEKSPRLKFAALQSGFAKQFFDSRGFAQPDLSTFYFWNGKKMYSKSDGALRVLKYLKFPYPLLQAGFIIPQAIRDSAYDSIAKRRHKLAGDFCAVPTPDQQKRFLE